jgi:hypothetical protein
LLPTQKNTLLLYASSQQCVSNAIRTQAITSRTHHEPMLPQLVKVLSLSKLFRSTNASSWGVMLSVRKHPALNYFNRRSLVLSGIQRRQLYQPDCNYKVHTKVNLGCGITLAGPSRTIPAWKRRACFSCLCDSTKLMEPAPSLLLNDHRTDPSAVTSVPISAHTATARTNWSASLTVTLFSVFAPCTSLPGTIELPSHLLECA